jgi:hypothetical protein
VNYGTAAVFEVVTIAFAAWVAHSVLRVRRRALGLASTQSQPVHRALALRTVVFGAVLFVALVYVHAPRKAASKVIVVAGLSSCVFSSTSRSRSPGYVSRLRS